MIEMREAHESEGATRDHLTNSISLGRQLLSKNDSNGL
jgi:hypothetical protein